MSTNSVPFRLAGVYILLYLCTCYSQSLPDFGLDRLVIPDYLLIGQQKSGTTTLAYTLVRHPDLRYTKWKELLYFTDNAGIERCNGLVKYLKTFQNALVKKPRRASEDLLKGEFSATYFSCTCCPRVFKSINPSLKIIIVLREPVSRAVSRFNEQRNMTSAPFRRYVAPFNTFLGFAKSELRKLKNCVGHSQYVSNNESKYAIELDCLFLSNILGWSAYSVFLKNWLTYFPPSQILVLYSNELDADMETSVQRIESFLGINHIDLPRDILQKKFNTHVKYGWNSFTHASSASIDIAHSDMTTTEGQELVDFYKPYVADLIKILSANGMRLPSDASFFKHMPEMLKNITAKPS